MLTYKIWDKNEEINGCDAQYIIKDMRIKESDEIILIYDDLTNKVSEIQFVDTLRSIYNITESNASKVAIKYLEIKEELRKESEKEQTILEEQEARISMLEKENQALKNELGKIQMSLTSLVSAVEK